MQLPTVSTPKGLEKNWRQLQNLASEQLDLKDLLYQAGRADNYSIEAAGIYYDYSKQKIDDTIKAQLLELATAAKVPQAIRAMFAGNPINYTENRAVLHTVLRAIDPGSVIGKQVNHQLQSMLDFADLFNSGSLKGFNGTTLDTVINIGIGGSDLGPKLLCSALINPKIENKFHFISNIDGASINKVLQQADLSKSLIIIQSKTFTTIETLTNAKTIIAQLQTLAGTATDISQHLVAVTANPEPALEFGIKADKVFQFWDWVGGRYSVWSTIGLPIALAVGSANFKQFLLGAAAMDNHFVSANLAENLPVISALVGIWNRNFLDYKDYALIPYSENLFYLPFYLQQLDMESNGKTITKDGCIANYATGPVVWGQTGTNGQHAFFQLLHQGTAISPVDFVGIADNSHSLAHHHKLLNQNMLAQSVALALGSKGCEAEPYKYYAGNRPSSTLLLNKLDSYNLGALIALYEHKVMVQGIIWGINSFDQWGVELGKKLANSIADNTHSLDPCSQKLAERLI